MSTLFLDLYGVLANSAVMERAYNVRMAAILHQRLGGSIDVWRDLQQESYERYQAEGLKLDARPGPDREGDAWVEAVWRMNADQVAWMFNRRGIPLPADPARYSEQLEEETVREIDALFEDVRPMLPRLKAGGHRIFLSTNATRSNGESALFGGGVLGAFDGVVCLDNAKAKKDRTYYWLRALEIAGVRPADAVCVDDVPRYLEPAEALGARCVQMVRGGPPHNTQRYPVVSSLEALSAWLARA
jgi:HAD superfamily hydrolase (TIGR01509 family)